MLAFLDRQQTEDATQFTLEQVQKKLGWIIRFRQPLKEWGELPQLTITTESFVRQRGLYRGAHLELAEQLQYVAHTDRTQRVRTELVAFVKQESARACPGERLLGSSKVIESILGKLKRLEQDQAKSGFTGLLLSIGAMVASTTLDVILKALEAVPTKKGSSLMQGDTGTFCSGKAKVFASPNKSEQKWDQSWAAV